MTQINSITLSEQQNSFCRFTLTQNLVLHIEATALGVFRVRCGTPNQLDESQLNVRAQARQSLLLSRQETSSEFLVEKTDNGWCLSQGNARLEVHQHPFVLYFYRGEECVLRSSQSPLSYDDNWSIEFHHLSHVYGLGRSEGEYQRQGKIVSDEENYLPFAWSPAGWGIFANSLQQVTHHIHQKKYQLYVDDSALDVFIYIGTVHDIFNQFSATIGRVIQPSLRAMGVWFNQAEQQSTNDFIQQTKQLEDEGFYVDTLRFSAPSMFAFPSDKLGLEWNEERTGDIREFSHTLLNGDKHLCFPTFVGIPTGTPLFADLEDRAWLLLDDNGKAHTWKTPSGKVGLLDLTYKDAYKVWESRHQQLLENTDAALEIIYPQYIPNGVSARQGEDKAFLRQLYPMWLEQSLFEAQSSDKTPSEAYVCKSSLSLNSARYTGLYVNHKVNSFDALRQLLRLHLTTQASGVISQAHILDMDTLDKSLYLRFLALSVFSSGFSISADSVSLPSAFDKETQKIIKMFLALRYRLVPYVLGMIEDANRTGLPMQRMMPLAFPDDTLAHAYEDQFLFGPALLVAPILHDDDRVSIYLPTGEAWWDLNTGVRYEGGQILDYQCNLDSIPVFGREGHMLCLGPDLKGLSEFNSARILEEVWLFGMPLHNPVVMRNKIRVMQMQGSSYIKGFEGLKILPSEGLEVKRRGAEVRISRER